MGINGPLLSLHRHLRRQNTAQHRETSRFHPRLSYRGDGIAWEARTEANIPAMGCRCSATGVAMVLVQSLDARGVATTVVLGNRWPTHSDLMVGRLDQPQACR